MAEARIIEVDSPGLLKEFVLFPTRLYRKDPRYVRPLDSERIEFLSPDKNPFFRGARVKLFLALRDGETVGRISTCVYYAHNEMHEEQVGFFGFFDTIDDEEVGHALLKVALITLKQEGMEKMRGPASFSLNHECGFMIEGFDEPTVILMPYNRPYQPRMAESFGMEKVMDLNAYTMSRYDPQPERIWRVAERLAKRSRAIVRPVNLKRFDDEVELIRVLYNEAWEKNWGFVPMTDEEFRYTAVQLKQIIDPELSLVAMVDSKAVGFSLSIPDFNQALIHLNGTLFPLGALKLFWHTKIRRKVRGLRTITMGILPEYRKIGIDALMHMQTFKNGVRRGYETSELSWILETNEMMNSLAVSLGSRLYKKFRIVEISI